MNDKIIEGVAHSTGFSPLEIVLMAAVVGMFIILLRILIKTIREVVQAVTNNTAALDSFKEWQRESTQRILESNGKKK